MSSKVDLGELIKAALKAEKVTQDELAGKMGVSRQTVNNHLSKRKIDADFLASLKEHTGIDYTDYYDKPHKVHDLAKKGFPKPGSLARFLNMQEWLKIEHTQTEIDNMAKLLKKLDEEHEKEDE